MCERVWLALTENDLSIKELHKLSHIRAWVDTLETALKHYPKSYGSYKIIKRAHFLPKQDKGFGAEMSLIKLVYNIIAYYSTHGKIENENNSHRKPSAAVVFCVFTLKRYRKHGILLGNEKRRRVSRKEFPPPVAKKPTVFLPAEIISLREVIVKETNE